MMAGTGVSSGGAGMLRARRRDVSVKPNRKLDRKSSRGMIYENEELRLRTIHINAEVEQGQNDIKKLRRENEQLRREIWSLRDEYDKLEEILKSQKNREGSEEYEDRSDKEDEDDDEEAEDGSDYSDEEDEEEEDDAGDDGAEGEERDQEERLENAENQKISSEKMNNSLHRLHVEFDDLSVVDEEEEVKRDKERKDVVSFDEKDVKKSENEPGPVRVEARNGYPCFPAQYGSSSGQTYYPDCPFSGEAGFSEIMPMNPSSMLLTPCPTIYDGSIASIPNFETPGINAMPPRYEENLRNHQMTYGSPVGWQSNIFTPNASFQMAESYQAGVMAAQASGICSVSMFTLSGQSDQSAATTTSTVRATSIPPGTPIDERTSTERLISPIESYATNVPSLLQRRNVLLNKQPNSFCREAIVPNRIGLGGIEAPSSATALTRNGWDFGPCGSISGNREMLRDTNDRKNEKDVQRERCEGGELAEKSEGQHRNDDSANAVSNGAFTDRPKHFFAPLPPKIQHGRQDSGDKTVPRMTIDPSDSPSITYLENFDTGRSSSSDRTNSTVISTQHFQRDHSTSETGNFSEGAGKGSADIYVNGAVPAYGSDQRDWSTGEHRTHKSSENLLVGDRDISRGNSSSRQGSNNPLVKSISCQDLTSEQLQNSLFEISRTFNSDNKAQKLTKSDNTLDNPVGGSPKPFRSQLNVTLRFPGRPDSPDTPEIPKLPSIDYRLFSNRFLKTFDPNRVNYGNYGIRNPVTRPLSIQVNENAQGKSMPHPAIDYSSAMLTQSFARRLNPEENAAKPTMRTFMNEVESDRHRVLLPSSTSEPIDSRIISSPKLRQEFQVTSFEQPNPRSLLPGLTAFDLDSLKRIPPATCANPIISNHQKLYQNVPFVPGGATAMFCPPGQSPLRMFFENQTTKVPAQTQTSIDGGSNHEDEAGNETVKDSKTANPEEPGAPSSPTSTRRKRTIRKGRSNQTTDKLPLSPAAQRRRLRKQSSINAEDGTESNKVVNKSRKFSPATTTTTTASDHLEDKNESRSSSSGQESPRKDHSRRVSLYFNSKKRSSLTSVKTARSGSIDNTKDVYGTRGGDPLDTTNSERERTNSVSSREAAGGNARKSSISSGKVPWCACWGNGCI